MTCNICYEKGYYLVTLDDDYEGVLCECQMTKERESK